MLSDPENVSFSSPGGFKHKFLISVSAFQIKISRMKQLRDDGYSVILLFFYLIFITATFCSFTVLRLHRTLVFLVLLRPDGGKLQVTGPSQPIVAILGEDITLPCRLDPPMNVSRIILEWARQDLSPGFVYERRRGEECVADRQPSYRGRTSVSVDKLELGDASMKLSKVTRSDEGTYRCHFPQLGQHALIRLVVGAVSTPVIEFVSNQSREVVLQCEAEGWYPEPELFWLDGEGNLLSAGPTETVRGPDDLYTVSRRLTVRKSDSFTCRVQQKNIKQTRETHFYVPEDFFTDLSSDQTDIIILFLLVLFIILPVIFMIERRRRAGMELVNIGLAFPMLPRQEETRRHVTPSEPE